ncbi:MAG: adenosylcobinamide amidohydrolase [Ornithinimicrobium sp.]
MTAPRPTAEPPSAAMTPLEVVPPHAGHRGVLCWRFAQPVTMLSSASVGGGLGIRHWLLNVGVPKGYARRDLDTHAGEVATGLGLHGEGATLFTAADVTRVQEAVETDVHVAATVGITAPTWAADRSGGFTPWTPGTINIAVHLPVALPPSALVNMVMTVTEAKTQALARAGVPGTGTASDAVAITCPPGDATEAFGGPRSRWGSRAALAVYAAVLAGSGPQ